jgi:hypothetical protein
MWQIVAQDDMNFNLYAPTAGELLHGAEEQQDMSYTCGIKARRYAEDKIIRCILNGLSASFILSNCNMLITIRCKCK